jgi:hypothetical protein
MKIDNYEPQQVGPVMKLLWKASGGDKFILERSTYSDQVKYACLGGIIVATGVMAALAGGYAFYTIFSPKDNDGYILDSTFYSLLSCLFGIIWGLVIFNIDRFIVTSTGKGDGTEAITWQEFTGAIPRIIMGIVISITISMPLEIRIFQTEVQAGLIEAKQKQGEIFRIGVEKRFKQRLSEIDAAIPPLIDEIDKNKLSWKAATSDPQLGGCTKGANCNDGKHKTLWSIAQIEENNWKASEAKNKPIIDTLNSEKNRLLKSRQLDLDGKTKDGEQLDGLAERIKQMHLKVPSGISWFITLLFLVIELTPIFFKLMLIKTPYDYLAENRDDLIKAKNGIEVKYDFYKEEKGLERHKIIHHSSEKLLHEKRLLAVAEKIINRYAIQKYIEREKNKIDKDDNLGGYIQSSDNNG